MIRAGSLEYAMARMHVRHALVPSARDWRDIEHARGLTGVLAAARETSLRPAMHGLADDAGLHDIDHALRSAWSALLTEVRRWLPTGWRRAIDWCEAIPRLDAVAALARGEPFAPWMRADPLLRGLEGRAPPTDHALAPLAPAWGDDARQAPALWAVEWKDRLPHEAREDEALGRLATHVGRHVEAFGDAATHDAPVMRAELRARALSTFRRHGSEPAGVVAWLLLCALDLERLRGELARRAAFPDARPVP